MKNLKFLTVFALFVIGCTTFEITAKKSKNYHHNYEITVLDNQLWSAVIEKKYDLVKKLISKGANPNTIFPFTGPLLSIAIEDNDKKMVILLLQNGADPNIKSMVLQETPLYTAIEVNKPDLVKILLDAGANPNIENDFSGKTSLHYAVEANNPKIVKMLLKAGANKNIETLFYHNTPLDLAKAQENINPEIITLLEE